MLSGNDKSEVEGVSSVHPEYSANLEKWQMVDKVVDSDVRDLIPPVETLTSVKNGTPTYSFLSKRNRDYVFRAQFVNFTRRTKNTWLGAIYRKDPVIQLPPDIEYLKSDATGSGDSLDRLSLNICSELLEKGRAGILVDYPASKFDVEYITEKDEEYFGYKARIFLYKPESIINWFETYENGIPRLMMVVLKECRPVLDGFEWTSKVNFRVLRLIEGVYVQTIYDEDEKTILEEYIPKDKNGNPFNYITFTFIGSHNNTTKVDPSPLYDIARLNIGHLINSADYEESVHLCSQPTLIIKSEMSQAEFDNANPYGVMIGSRRGLNLGINSDASFLQANPNQLADEAMKRKEEQAQMIGAKFVTPGGTNETAEGVRMRLTGETSELTLIAKNCQDALTRACKQALMFMSGEAKDDQILISINTDFIDLNLDGGLLAQMQMLVNNGIISKNDLRNMLRESGDLPANRTDDDIDNDISEEFNRIDPLSDIQDNAGEP